MKRTFTSLLLCLSLPVCVLAQKVDLDRASFPYTYTDLPTNPLPFEYKTYSVVVEATPSVKANLSEDQIINITNIEGWKKLPGSAQLTVYVNLDDVIIETAEVKERVSINKDKDGKETSRKYYYWLEMSYSFAASARVLDHQGNAVEKNIGLANRFSRMSFQSEEFGSYEAASNYFSNNKTSLKTRFIREQGNYVLAYLNKTLSNKYGYPVRRGTDILWILDSKKHPEFAAYQEQFTLFKTAMGEMKADSPVASVKEKISGFISYLEGIPGRYTTDEKADRKLRYASYFNLSKIYMYLDEPEKATEYANKLAANDYDSNDSKSLNESAHLIQEAFEKNKTTTRHFSTDFTSLNPR